MATFLRTLGHDVDTTADEMLGGAADPKVLATATQAGRALVTLDKDFSDVRVYPPNRTAGIILLRPAKTSAGGVRRFVEAHFSSITLPSLKGRLVVVTEMGARFR